MLAPVALAALLLAADGPDIHFGGQIGLGLGVPFNVASPGFQFGATLFAEFEVAPKVGIGLSVPFGFGFASSTQNSSFASLTFTAVDIMPGAHASYAVNEWVTAALDLGLGPNILTTKTDVAFFNASQSTTNTYFAMRVALGVFVHPPSLSGLMFGVQPLEIDGRVGNQTFSEYRLSFLVGYRH